MQDVFNELDPEERFSAVNKNICAKYLDKRRAKRGLIDVGGQVLHALFGTATDQQIDEAKADMQIMTVKLNRLHLITEETKRRLTTQQNILNETLRVLGQQTLRDRVLGLCTSYNKLREDARTNEIDITRELNVQLIQEQVSKFSLKNNLFPVGTVNSQDFQQTIRTILRQNTIILTIPFTNKIVYYHVLLQPVPIFLNQTRVIVEIQNKHVILNKANARIGYPDEQVIKKCIHTKGEYLCKPIILWNIKGKTRRCEEEIVLNKPMESCTFTTVREDSTRMLRTKRRVYLFEKPGTALTIYCDNNLRHTTVDNTGIQMVPRGCTIVSGKMRFEDTKVAHSKTTSEIDFSNTTLRLIKLDNETTTKILKEMKNDWDNTEIPWEPLNLGGWGNWGWILVPIAFGLGILGVLGWQKWIRKRRNVHNTQEQSDRNESSREVKESKSRSQEVPPPTEQQQGQPHQEVPAPTGKQQGQPHKEVETSTVDKRVASNSVLMVTVDDHEDIFEE